MEEEKINQEILDIETEDISGCFSQEMVISKKKFEEIQKVKLNLKEGDGFKDPLFLLRKIFPRKNIIYYGISNKEIFHQSSNSKITINLNF